MAVTKKPVAKKAQIHQKSGKKGIKGGKIRGKGIKRKINLKFVIDCTHPAEDSILDVGNFEKYLKERVKVDGKTNNLGNHVVVVRDKTKVAISAGKIQKVIFLIFLILYLPGIDNAIAFCCLSITPMTWSQTKEFLVL